MPYLGCVHGLKLVRVVDMFSGWWGGVVDEVGILGLSIGEEVEGFLFEPDKHDGDLSLKQSQLLFH